MSGPEQPKKTYFLHRLVGMDVRRREEAFLRIVTSPECTVSIGNHVADDA